MSYIKKVDPELYEIINREQNREHDTLELIASENFTSPAILEAAGGIMTNKYAEGYPGKRYYGGCIHVDEAENLAIDRLKKLFGVEYANVQPHSGSQANMAVFMTFLNPGDTIMGLELSHGGHLTHGSAVNFSGQLYNSISYHVDKETGRVNFDEVRSLALEHKPKMIICGGSAYPRYVEFDKFYEVAQEIGAFLMADIAHPSGLIAAGVHPSPVPYCDVITSTTHKTLRGPRGGIIMMRHNFDNPFGLKWNNGNLKSMASLLDAAVFPGTQGGPLEHVIAAKAVAFGEALEPSFHKYQERVKENAQIMAKEFVQRGYTVISNGTDNHCMLIDLRSKGINGKDAELALNNAHVTLNKNMVPFDTESPFVTSGIRIGTPAITTRGITKNDIPNIVGLIDKVIENSKDNSIISKVKNEISEMMSARPLFQL